jgi:hypothetical protein
MDVQAVFLATPPFLDVIGDPDPAALLDFAGQIERLAGKYGIDGVSIGPVVATTPLALLMSIHALPQLIKQTKSIYSGVLFADQNSGINLAAAHAFAQVVHKVAHESPNGLGNLRLAALANMPDSVPYFPAAYHHGGLPSFAIAAEAVDVAMRGIEQAPSLGQVFQGVVSAIEKAAAPLLEVVDHLVDDHHLAFKGLDLSIAPSANENLSLGSAIENLGIEVFGGNGTLFATNFLATCIQEANIPHANLSGVMLPVLEDARLAQRARQGHFDVNDLLFYSAVCGAGLDAVPIPGETQPEEIAAIFLDMATLAISTNKPLLARLLPMPGLKAGQEVSLALNPTTLTGYVLPVKKSGAQKLFRRATFFKTHSTVIRTRQRSTSSYPIIHSSRKRR